jgi:hypothetical protein
METPQERASGSIGEKMSLRCDAKTAAGFPCQNWAVGDTGGRNYCHITSHRRQIEKQIERIVEDTSRDAEVGGEEREGTTAQPKAPTGLTVVHPEKAPLTGAVIEEDEAPEEAIEEAIEEAVVLPDEVPPAATRREILEAVSGTPCSSCGHTMALAFSPSVVSLEAGTKLRCLFCGTPHEL